MDFVTPIITPIVESLLVPIKRHLGFLVSSTKYVREMHAKVSELNRATLDVDTKQKANNASSLVIPGNVPGWLGEVEKIKERKDSIPTGGVGCFNIKMRYKAGKQSFYIVKDIVTLIKEKNEMVWTGAIVPLAMVSPTRPTTSATVHDDNQNKNIIKFKSRDMIFDAALTSLELNKTKNQSLALCGMGGVGKTTMMKQLEMAARDKKMFDSIVNVTVGQKPNLSNVQKQVAEYYTGHDLTETTEHLRAERLKNLFKEISEDGKKKILIIMDDVWEKLNLKDIGLTSPLPDGFKLLITSREENVCTLMDVDASSIFKVVVLEESEAKTLFWETVGIVADSDHIEPGLHEIGEEIIKGCRGLPIAIKTIADTLKVNKKKHSWEDALLLLRNKEFNVFSIFEISYDNLKEDAKEIFLLCGLFPDDYNIGIEDLLRYGWGLKLFKNVRTLAEARNRVNTCVDNLRSSNLLIESDREGCVKMHDLVRDFALSNISKVKQASIVNYDTNVCEQLIEDDSYERILLNCKGMVEFPLDFKKPNLTFLKLMGGDKRLKFPEDFYTRMEKLEVAAYVNMDDLHLLPQYSTKLRTLSLRSCSLMYDISFLGDLINLEVLTLADCGIRKLPSKLGKLKRLRLLDLTGCFDLCIDDGVFQNLDKLEELYMSVSNNKAIRFTDANFEELKMLSRKLSALEVEFVKNNVQLEYASCKSLKRFRISMGCFLRKKLQVGEYSFKNTLELVTSRMELLGCKINESFKETEILYLEVNDMSYLQDILPHDTGEESFSNLKVLHVYRCASLTFLFNVHVAEGLKNLETLEVSSCDVLESMVVGENMGGGGIKFDKLKILSLEYLPGLVSFCDSVNIMELPQLLELRLNQLENFTSIFPENNTNISAKQSFFKKEDVIPKLKKLTISNMKNLKVIWPHEITSSEEEVNNVSMLREITVEMCHSLQNLFPSNPMRLLSHLERLTIRTCGSIEVLFNIDLGKFELNCISNLRSIIVTGCDSFREAWRIKDVENNYSGFLIRGFHAIESIGISHCQKFRNLVTPITTNFDMRALKDIHITGCGESDERKNELVTNKQEHQIISHVSKEDMSKMGVLMSIVSLPSFENTLNFHHLRKITLHEFEGVEVVFEIQSPRYRDQCVKTQQPLLLLPNLEELDIRDMGKLSHVWKCSKWNEFFMLKKHQPQLSSFQNLTTIHMRKCNSIKYLFSPLMVKLLSNLKNIYIDGCDTMEEVVSNRDDKDEEMMTSTLIHPTTTLDTLYLDTLDNLKHIGGGESKFYQVNVVSWSLCQYSKEIYIVFCGALESVIQSYAAEQIQNLQVLVIRSCKSMTEVFETKEIIGNVDPGSDKTVAVPRSKSITTHKLPNLKILKIVGCHRLEIICTFSTFESLKKLETLEITDCEALKVIVREDYREQATTSTSKDVTFPHLKSIKLENLPKLASFFLGNNIDFQWPLLDDVMINRCPQMIAFTSGRSTAPKLKYIHTELGKHLADLQLPSSSTLHQIPHQSIDDIISHPTTSQWRTWSFHSLIECNLKSHDCHTNIFPSNELQQLQKLETIHAKYCNDVEEVFEVALGVTNNYESQTVTFPKLREVSLHCLDNLKYIWKSNQRRILEFPNLTRLSITFCGSLEHVFTYSMVGCVMQLQQLHIRGCKKMKAIVKEEEDCDAKVSEIKFPCLKSLKLDNLSSFQGFCLGNDDFTFSSLDTLEIKKCPRITVFTKGRSIAPKLQVVETSQGSIDVGEDINSFITTKKQEGFSFGEINSE